jgi:hypothetical protein
MGFEISMFKIFEILKLSYLQLNGLKLFCCYKCHEVRLCGGCIHNLYVDAAVVLARYVLQLKKQYIT